MATTYDPIASTTLTSSASSVAFSSLDTIAAGYRDLILVSNAVGSGSGIDVYIRLNGDTGSNYNRAYMSGTGSSTYAGTSTNATWFFLTAWAALHNSNPWQNTFELMDFSATDKHKSALWRTDQASNYGTEAMAGRWASTSAVTSLVIGTTSGSFNSGATFALYGVAA